MTTTQSPQYRYIGTTDEQTQCDKCGRAELRSTVIVAELDQDGNVAEVLHYGSTCAARALSARYGVKVTKAQVMNAAASAELDRRNAARDARDMLAYYGLPERGAASEYAIQCAAESYAHHHRMASWAPGMTAADWQAKVRDMLVRKQAALAAV
jgi:hypothetical protein